MISAFTSNPRRARTAASSTTRKNRKHYLESEGLEELELIRFYPPSLGADRHQYARICRVAAFAHERRRSRQQNKKLRGNIGAKYAPTVANGLPGAGSRISCVAVYVSEGEGLLLPTNSIAALLGAKKVLPTPHAGGPVHLFFERLPKDNYKKLLQAGSASSFHLLAAPVRKTLARAPAELRFPLPLFRLRSPPPRLLLPPSLPPPQRTVLLLPGASWGEPALSPSDLWGKACPSRPLGKS